MSSNTRTLFSASSDRERFFLGGLCMPTECAWVPSGREQRTVERAARLAPGGPSGSRLLRFGHGGIADVPVPEEAPARGLHIPGGEPAVAVDLLLSNPGIARRRPLSGQRLDGDGLVQRLLTPR